MSTPTFTYPFDPTGALASNKIEGERQVLSAPQHTRFFFVIPYCAPFFRAGHRFIHRPSGRVLVEGEDYALTHRFHDASLAVGRAVYGSVTFFNHSLTGQIEMEYQTLGGAWVLNRNEITEILANSLIDPRITTWEMITDLPYRFPVIDHEWDLVDMVGASALVEKLGEIEDAIREAAEGANTAHVNDRNNPHEVNKAQVGLPLVDNFATANALQAIEGLASNLFMTPFTTGEAIDSRVGDDFEAHVANQNNPHGTTKAHVGLPNVQDYGVASNQQAIDGTANNLYMTPVNTRAALLAWATPFTAHINDQNNPHGTTKAQVGLPLVENLPVSDRNTALAATSNLHYMTPLRTRELLEALVGQTVIDHVNNQNNPHNTTKSHVGLSSVQNLPLATAEAARSGADDSGYMTPRLTYEAIIALAGSGGGGGADIVHRARQDNPHDVTAEQVGAYSKPETDALLAQRLATNATATNADRLGGQTPAEIIRAAKARFDWPAVTTGNETWTVLGNFIPPGVLDDDHPVADMVFYFTGGDRRTANMIPIYLVKLNIYPQPKLEVEQLAGVVNETMFGYTRDNSTNVITLYVKSAPERNGMSVLVMSDPTNGLGVAQAPTTTEPTGIVYSDSFVYMGGSPNVDAFVGDTLMGKNPHFPNLSDFASAMDFVNVTTTSDEAFAARNQSARSMRDDYHDFIPASAWETTSRNAVLADMLGWSWRVNVNSLLHASAGTSLLSLLSPVAYSSYAFEVEISSTSATDMAAGVCAAFVRKNGKDYGIYALRSPGGLAVASAAGSLPGGDIYEHFSVGYNLLQEDALDLGSISSGVTGAADWAAAGVCRMRVTRNGNVIIIQTTQFGSTDYATGKNITIDLDTHPELAVFKTPTHWGYSKYAQANTFFKTINRPDASPPYVTLSADADGNDTSVLYRNNGVQWVGQPMVLSNSFIKANRMYYSELTARFYWARRDGTLREVSTAAFANQATTALTD
jgi:hypothetical protein